MLSDIKIEVQPIGVNHSKILEFATLCQENEIRCQVRTEEFGVIKQCALDNLIAIVIDPVVWQTILTGQFVNLTYDIFKSLILQMLKSTKSSKHCNSMKIITNNTQFILEAETISEEMVFKGLDSFVKIAIENADKEYTPREKMLSKMVVFPNTETGEIEILGELDFVKKHIAKMPNQEK